MRLPFPYRKSPYLRGVVSVYLDFGNLLEVSEVFYQEPHSSINLSKINLNEDEFSWICDNCFKP
jgi:hypothetical protein